MHDLTVLIGARGYLGGHLRPRLERDGHRVVSAPSWNSGIDRLAFERDLEQLMRPADRCVIINTVGGRVDGRSRDGSDLSYKLNISSMNAITDVLHRRGGADSLIHFGSAAEYGRSHVPCDEENACAPLDEYGRLKCEATQIALSHPSTVILRLFNIASSDLPPSTLLGRLSRSIASDERSFVCGDLGAVRDFVSIDDLSEAVVAARSFLASSTGAVSEIINVGSGRGVLVRDLVQRVIHRTGSDILVEEHRGEVTIPVSIAATAKAERLLRWSSVSSIDSLTEDLFSYSSGGLEDLKEPNA